ncbi:MBL fold metallo-hydrolase [Klebsiella aerogenes]|uniref:MBL fold metallo-hydrolase n=2 Tax=Klebsiella TaxID=570 RepID=UPI000B411A0A|nr:MBL fold metallo-hydrolase [Klebsiella aerogenes]MEB7639225.1 MBL fold metallo-hydrolase [Klebsiella aerogenes]RNT27593.1 MBL fold metallo-hydrolase [Klebsiella aerogenes]HDS4949098.1 MBL fold metallo-hydrolase [Klebsiella aerogenes]
MNEKLPMKDLGDVLVTAVSDGYLQVDFGLLANVDETECRAIQQKSCPEEPNSVHINTFLVQQQGKNILIDSGAGGIKGWGGGLVKNLAKLGLQPDDIDAVLLTHAHPDHIGGLVNAQGEAIFPRAELFISRDEYDYLQDDNQFATVSDRIKGNFLLARSVFKQYQDRLQLIDDGEVLAGIRAIPLKGHTPGHTGYSIVGSHNSLLIWGDIVHFPHIQLLKPDVTIAFDYDPQLAAETRARILEMASSDQVLVGGMHFGLQGFGYIKKLNTGYCIITDE